MKIKKTENIILRCTAFEKKSIEIKAQNTGLSVSEFCRRTALSRNLPKIMTSEELEVYQMLKKYQADWARIANLFKNKDPKFHEEIRPKVLKVRKAV